MSGVVSEAMIVQTIKEVNNYKDRIQEDVNSLINNINAIESVLEIIPYCYNTTGGNNRYKQISNIDFNVGDLSSLAASVNFSCNYSMQTIIKKE